jgi:4-oxalocrotonate tautomerase
MPVVDVKMWEGRSAEDKNRLIAAISKAFEDALNVKSDHLTIVIIDIPKENWGSRGKSAVNW